MRLHSLGFTENFAWSSNGSVLVDLIFHLELTSRLSKEKKIRRWRSRHRTDPVVVIFYRFSQKHNVFKAGFLRNNDGYIADLAPQKLSGQINYSNRNHTGKWFQVLIMRIDRFSTSSVQSDQHSRWLRYFGYQSNHDWQTKR